MFIEVISFIKKIFKSLFDHPFWYDGWNLYDEFESFSSKISGNTSFLIPGNKSTALFCFSNEPISPHFSVETCTFKAGL